MLLGLLEMAASKEPYDWNLPPLACQAVGGRPEQATPAAAAIACLQMSIIHIDDMLDADPRGLYQEIGMPAVANVAAAFQAAGLEAIARANLEQDVKLAALRGLNLMALTTAYGQYLDVQNPADEAAYWRLVQTKSSPFFAAAMYVGALFGNAPACVAEKLRQFGCLYGEIIQIHDDLKDTMAKPANPDWLCGRSPLPILYARVVPHHDRERFLALRGAVADPEILAEAQIILIRCGAVSYCVDQIVRRSRRLQHLLRTLSPNNATGLEGMLKPLTSPLRALFAAVGIQGIDGLLDL
jgi:geranylgeranyl pyrophosphate synthase